MVPAVPDTGKERPAVHELGVEDKENLALSGPGSDSRPLFVFQAPASAASQRRPLAPRANETPIRVALEPLSVRKLHLASDMKPGTLETPQRKDDWSRSYQVRVFAFRGTPVA
jgi:hypothetical protein